MVIEIYYISPFVLVLFQRIESIIFTDQTVYVTNRATFNKDIPADCPLFGTEFDRQHLLNDTYFNITSSGIFWVSALVGLQRNINPLGATYRCTDNAQDLSLDECSVKCQNYTYFKLGGASCTCWNIKPDFESMRRAEKCSNRKVLCLSDQCIVYEKVNQEDNHLCGTYTYNKYGYYRWWFELENCLARRPYSYLCSNGNVGDKTKPLSWYEAFQYCKDNGSNLVESYTFFKDKHTDGTSYWVSFFRRTEFFWGRGDSRQLCVALNITPNKTPLFVSRFCTDKLPALCHKVEDDPQTMVWTAGLVTGLVIMIIIIPIIAVALFIYLWSKKHQNKDDRLELKREKIKNGKEGVDNPLMTNNTPI